MRKELITGREQRPLRQQKADADQWKPMMVVLIPAAPAGRGRGRLPPGRRGACVRSVAEVRGSRRAP